MKTAALLVSILLGAACAPGATRQSARSPALEMKSEFAPAGRPADSYNDGAPTPPSSPEIDAIVRRVGEIAARGARTAPAPDGRLFAVAREMAELLGEGPPPYEAVNFALSHHGIIEPSPHLLVVRMTGDALDGVLGEMEARLPNILAGSHFVRLGVGVAPSGERDGAPISTVVVALQESAIETEPIARELSRGGRMRIRGRVLPPFHDPKVYTHAPGGVVAAAPMVRDSDGGFRADVACGDDGKLKVEIVGSDKLESPTVLANFSVWCGVSAPRSLTLAAPEEPPRDAAEGEKDIFDYANRDRAANGLPPLAWDDRAAAIARLHSEDMRDHSYVAHVSPRTGSALDRARRGGLSTPLILENLARAYSAREAHTGLMNSPGHRANLMTTQATHLGVGVALGAEVGGQRELYVTQLFFRKNPKLDLRSARLELVRAVAKARADSGLQPAAEDPALDQIAGAYASGLAAGEPDEKVGARADLDLDRLVERFSRVATITSVTGDPVSAVREAVLDANARWFGVGIAQGRHVEIGDGAMFVVILMARGR